MWSGWPSAGAVLSVDVDVPDGVVLTSLPSRVRDVLEDGLRIQAPRIEGLGRTQLTGASVVIRWRDPYRGLCASPAIITWADMNDRFTPWRIVITGDTQYVQRRRYVREGVPGRATVTPKSLVNPEGQAYRVGGPEAGRIAPGMDTVGVIGDLSEGGVRMIVTELPLVREGREVRVVLELDDDDFEADLDGQIVRVVGADHRMWEVAAMFPDPHPLQDRIRAIVFKYQRKRLNSVLGQR